jgi:alpha-glucosidase
MAPAEIRGNGNWGGQVKKQWFGPGYRPLGELERIEQTPAGVRLWAGPAVVEVQARSEHVFRVRAARGGLPEDRSYAVEPAPPLPLAVLETPEAVELSTAQLTLAVGRRPLRLLFRNRQGEVLCREDPARGMGFEGEAGLVSMSSHPDERYFGFGEKTRGLNKRGVRMTMWNTDMPYTGTWDPMYSTIPWVIVFRAGRACGLFFDNPAKNHFDMGKSNPSAWTYLVEGGGLNYYFLDGPDLPSLIGRFTALTGRLPMPPRWSLGHHQSRWGYRTEAQVKEIAKNFRDKDIPTDVIHLDIHWMRGYRVFEFDPVRFSKPKALTEEVGRQGFRLVTIIDPGVKVDPEFRVYREGRDQGFFCASESGREFHARVWPGRSAFPDFIRPEASDWWGEQQRALVEAGISGVWNDMNDPSCWTADLRLGDYILVLRPLRHPKMVHRENGRVVPHLLRRNVYGHLMCQATREGLLRHRPGVRPFVLTRSAYAGTQRYAALWTGDNSSTFAQLGLSVPMILNLGLSGLAFVGADIGGFMWNCSPELYARWIELGAFYPFCRTHCAIAMRSQEPWSFGPEVEAIARDYLKLRYALMPTIYSLFRQCHETGWPLWRPLCFEFPEDSRAAEIEDQIMVGPDLMLAPVTKKGRRSRSVYLPAGVWTDYWTGERVLGLHTLERPAPLSLLPMYLREGAVLFRQPPCAYLDQRPADRITFEIYPPAREKRTVLYEDDGNTLDCEQGIWSKTELRVDREGSDLHLLLMTRLGNYRPPERRFGFRVHHLERVKKVWRDGQALAAGDWTWDEKQKLLGLEFEDDGQAHQVRIEF